MSTNAKNVCLAENCLDYLNKLFNCKGAATPETKAFKDISHEGLCQALVYWIEQMRIVINEPVNVVITQSLHDEGVDLVVEFQRSKVKIGFQVKSFNDVEGKEFTQSCIAQITRSRKHGISYLIFAVAGDLTQASHQQKVRGLLSEISQLDDYCTFFSPERTLMIYQTFANKEHPITKVEGQSDIALLIHELQKKLSQDPQYEHKITWTSKLRDQNAKGGPIKFHLSVEQPPGSKTITDIIKEVTLTGKPTTIKGEYIKKLEVIENGKKVISEKCGYLTIEPTKNQIPLSLEITDLDDSLIVFDNLRFNLLARIGSTVHISTLENNLPYRFAFSLDIGHNDFGNFEASIVDPADVSQRYKLMRLLASINVGKELMLKNPEGNIIASALFNPGEMAVPIQELHLLEKLDYIQKRTGYAIFPSILTKDDLSAIDYGYELLKEGQAPVHSICISWRLEKRTAEAIVQEVIKKGYIENVQLSGGTVEITLFDKKINLGEGAYLIPKLTITEDLDELQEKIKKLSETEIVLEVRNAPECEVTAVLLNQDLADKKGSEQNKP